MTTLKNVADRNSRFAIEAGLADGRTSGDAKPGLASRLSRSFPSRICCHQTHRLAPRTA
jgi:hypothetical protein